VPSGAARTTTGITVAIARDPALVRTVRLRVEDRPRVSVVAEGSVAAQDAPTSDIDGVEPWALLRGLIEDFEISQDAGSTVLSMSWPLS
jgi:hypothetical protein